MSASVPPRPDGLLVDVGPPKATWRWWEVLVAVPVALVAGQLVSLPLAIVLDLRAGVPIGGEELLFSTVSNIASMVVLVLWLRTAHPAWARIIGWPDRAHVVRELAIGAGLGVLVRVGSVTMAVAVVIALRGATDRSVELPDQVSPGLVGWELVIFAIFAVIAAPVLEEFAFRGLLFRSIADRSGFRAGAVVSAVAFGAFHLLTPGDGLGVLALGIVHVGTGLGLSWIYWRRRNLLASIAGHAAFNLIGVVSIVAGWEV
jgi:membrane protease YdiL (CAAX protease family)